jgi:hypothetical protein
VLCSRSTRKSFSQFRRDVGRSRGRGRTGAHSVSCNTFRNVFLFFFFFLSAKSTQFTITKLHVRTSYASRSSRKKETKSNCAWLFLRHPLKKKNSTCSRTRRWGKSKIRLLFWASEEKKIDRPYRRDIMLVGMINGSWAAIYCDEK